MAKYDEQFKLDVVRRYLSEQQSYAEVAREVGVDYSLLRRWVAVYQLHGQGGLVRPRKRYSAQFKFEVLKRIEQDGLSDRQAVAVYNLGDSGIIGKWRRGYDEGGMGALEPRRRDSPAMPHKYPPEPTPKDMTEKQLREENAYLRAELDYLKKLDALIQAERTEALVKKRKWSKG
ncbi:transposase [Achromobacter sp. SLBN-14]|jgi:transposase|nr:transposase [Achromobacter sp. SLBN-14]